MKYLVYTTTGGNPVYVSMARLMFQSIISWNNPDIDLAVMADDDSYFLLNIPQVKQIQFLPEDNGVAVSMRKVRVFDVMETSEYERLLFVDCDVLFDIDPKFIFSLEMDEQKLGVFCEIADDQWFTLPFWALGELPYTEEDLKAMNLNAQRPFNCGTFMFKPNAIMKEHFKTVCKIIDNYKGGQYFYEQSFMNYHFLRNNATHPVFNETNYELGPRSEVRQRCLLHFCKPPRNGDDKLICMKQYFWMYLRNHLFETRQDMLLAVCNPFSTLCEIGCFKGEFLQFMLDKLNPSKVIAIDLWNGSCNSGDQDGNNSRVINLEHAYLELVKKHESDCRVSLRKGRSKEILNQLDDNSLDIVYIDADHSYLGCKEDLEMSWIKVKKGGWIMGHDYELNFSKARTVWSFGVKQAVDEFCEKYNVKILVKGMDGCVSYGILKIL